MNRSWVCVDASVIVKLVIDVREDMPLFGLWRAWQSSGRILAAPSLLYYEAANAFHRHVVHGRLTADEARNAMETVFGFGISIHRDEGLHRRALDLAAQLSLPAAYDAHYLALTERLDAEFWTADRRLVQATSGTPLSVHLVEDKP